MTAPLESWKVLPHGQLTEVDDKVVDGHGHDPHARRRLRAAHDGRAAARLVSHGEPIVDDPRAELSGSLR